MERNHRPNLGEFEGEELAGLSDALHHHDTGTASEIIGNHLRKKIQGPLPGKPQEIPQIRKPEVQKKHIKRDGRR